MRYLDLSQSIHQLEELITLQDSCTEIRQILQGNNQNKAMQSSIRSQLFGLYPIRLTVFVNQNFYPERWNDVEALFAN